LILGAAVLVVLIPQAASAQCLAQPFDNVVRSSDSVLLATVAEARPTGNSPITVRLDVEQVLKGSAGDGRSVSLSSCGPVAVGPAAVAMAQGMVGTRGLFLLSDGRGGRVFQNPLIATPQGMTLDQRIAEARRVLGLPAIPVVHDARGTISSWTLALWAGLLVAAIILLIAGVVSVSRRARRA